MEKVLKWLDEEGGVKGVTVADAGCGTGEDWGPRGVGDGFLAVVPTLCCFKAATCHVSTAPSAAAFGGEGDGGSQQVVCTMFGGNCSWSRR